MAIFIQTPLTGFYGVLGSLCVHIALCFMFLVFVTCTETAIIGDTAENNQILYDKQVSFRYSAIFGHLAIASIMIFSQLANISWHSTVTFLIVFAMFTEIFLVGFAMDFFSFYFKQYDNFAEEFKRYFFVLIIESLVLASALASNAFFLGIRSCFD